MRAEHTGATVCTDSSPRQRQGTHNTDVPELFPWGASSELPQSYEPINEAHTLLTYPSSGLVFVWVAKWSPMSKLQGYCRHFYGAVRLTGRKQGMPEVWLA